MKILVPVKRVVDANVKVRVKADGSGVELDNVKMAINPYDEVAVEQAVRLKEAGQATEVVAVSCGPAACQDVLRTALAIGADRAVLLQSDAELQPLAVAKLLAALARTEAPQLCILGKQAIDDDCNQTGQLLAALLGWPQATFASHLRADGGLLVVQREIDGGVEMVQLAYPAVVTADLRLNDPRFVSLPNLMQSKKKPLAVVPADTLGVDLTPRWTTLQVSPPRAREPGVLVKDAAALVHHLKNVLHVTLEQTP